VGVSQGSVVDAAELNRKFPELARYLQPKCGEHRLGYCDESYEDWQACPIGRKRPHKRDLFQLFDSYRRGELSPLDEADFRIIQQEPSSPGVGRPRPASEPSAQPLTRVVHYRRAQRIDARRARSDFVSTQRTHISSRSGPPKRLPRQMVQA